MLFDRIVMMTNGPAATIDEILKIELERPRNRVELADDAEYNHYRHKVLEFLYERQHVPGDEKPVSKTQQDNSTLALSLADSEAA